MWEGLHVPGGQPISGPVVPFDAIALPVAVRELIMIGFTR